MKNSKRKSVFNGTQEIAATHGGEISRAVLMKIKLQDRNYIKLFKPDEGVYQMRPREMTLASIHLFDYLSIIAGPKDNIAATTTAEIEQRIKYSPASIARAKGQLRKMDYIRQKAQNLYMLNPEIQAQVDGDKRKALVDIYQALKPPKIDQF
jgi:uncharacterized small protein (DUF1192 family)